jgi:DNA-binding NarL/FixJ family response regulator
MDQDASGEIAANPPALEGRVTLLIEARSLTRQCLAAWLEQWERPVAIRAVATPDEAVEQEGDRAGLLIWCIGALAVTSVEIITGIDKLKQRFSTTPLAVLADREEPEDIRAAIRLGVRGYVPTSLDRNEALEVLKFVRAGGTYVPASALIEGDGLGRDNDRPPCLKRGGQALGQSNRFEGLTPREADVVDRLRQGKPNKVIAHELDISESTVKVFVHRILNKLGAVNRTEVAYLAQQQQSEIEDRSEPIA